MTGIPHFTGFIRGVKYKTYLADELQRIAFADFNINKSGTTGLLQIEDLELAFSKWVSPKRTRSYPFARIYDTYNASKVITIIPILKDEGKDGDLDKIQYSTISWMNLLNIYVVLGYYESAEKNHNKSQTSKDKLTKQKFNNEFIKSQIQEIAWYKQSALHWNKNLIEERFINIFEIALDSYRTISRITGVKIHDYSGIDAYLDSIKTDFSQFKDISLDNSKRATLRESLTNHDFELLQDGSKAIIDIQNYLGGFYCLTIDEVFYENGIYFIQESKNASNDRLPKLADIKDGLFKLILYSNLDSLYLNEEKLDFFVCLNLTGKDIEGSIILPCCKDVLADFFQKNNQLTNKEKNIISKLSVESSQNSNLRIRIRSNT